MVLSSLLSELAVLLLIDDGSFFHHFELLRILLFFLQSEPLFIAKSIQILRL